MAGTVKFFLGADGPQVAFLRENTQATFPAALHRDGISAADVSDPTDFADAVDVKNANTVVINVYPSDPAATYTLQFLGAYDPTRDSPSQLAADTGYFAMDEAEFVDLSGPTVLIGSVRGLDGIYARLDAISAGSLKIEIGTLQIEDDV